MCVCVRAIVLQVADKHIYMIVVAKASLQRELVADACHAQQLLTLRYATHYHTMLQTHHTTQMLQQQ
jgi:hypothetical protein